MHKRIDVKEYHVKAKVRGAPCASIWMSMFPLGEYIPYNIGNGNLM